MKNTTILGLVTVSFSLALAAVTGCGSSSNGTSSSTSSSSSGATTTSSSSSGTTSSSSSSSSGTTSSSSSSSSGSTNPTPPTIGMQLDRLGRPAINTALNHGFDSTAAAGTAKDTYNADSTTTAWKTNYAAQFAANLAIIDVLNGTCGDQIGYAKPAAATSYGLLAGALTDDRLYLNTAGTTHAQYLAVEANLLGVTNTDQGGRTLSENVMDTTYSVLAAGALTGVSNGITANEVAFSTTFPYEAAPN